MILRNTFLITGMPRSGTRFLSKIMNKSKKWRVIQEVKGEQIYPWVPPDQSIRSYVKIVKNRFEQMGEYYGEISWYLLNIIDILPLQYKGLIIRDPVEIWISIMNKSSVRAGKKLYHFYPFSRRMESLAATGSYHIISFKRMTTDKDYLDSVLRKFGIDDVEITDEILVPKYNIGQKKTYKSLDDFDAKTRTEVLQWKEIIGRWLD